VEASERKTREEKATSVDGCGPGVTWHVTPKARRSKLRSSWAVNEYYESELNWEQRNARYNNAIAGSQSRG